MCAVKSPPAIVLIPGAGGDSYYWHRVVPLLVDRGHDVVSPDLPAADDSAGIEEYADAVAAANDRAPLADAVLDAVGVRTDVALIAQSMGGYTAVAVAERMPVRLIVFVNAMIPGNDTAGAWWDATGQPDAQQANDRVEGREPGAEFDVATMFLHDLDPEVVAALMARGASPQSGTPFTSPNTWAAWKDVPARAIASTRDRLFPIGFMRIQLSDRLGIEPDEIDAGHLVALSRPRELALLLANYLEGAR